MPSSDAFVAQTSLLLAPNLNDSRFTIHVFKACL